MMGSNRTITILRPTSSGAGVTDYTTPTTVVSGLEAYIMEMKIERQQFYNMGPAYRAYYLNLDDYTDLQENDKITDDLGYTYIVHSIEKIDDPMDSYLVGVLKRGL